MRTRILTLGALSLFLVACSPADDGAAPSATTDVSAAEPSAAAPPTTEPAASSPPATAAPAEQSWIMPNLVGSNLQDAQDAIQALTDSAIFITTSDDATGQDRAQVLDSNWKVCTQNVAAGATITTGTQIEFGAVKLEEDCP